MRRRKPITFFMVASLIKNMNSYFSQWQHYDQPPRLVYRQGENEYCVECQNDGMTYTMWAAKSLRELYTFLQGMLHAHGLWKIEATRREITALKRGKEEGRSEVIDAL